MHIQELRNLVPFEEIDYVFLKNTLSSFAQPRNKIQSLLRIKDLIRIKKGLYVFGPKVARIPYCKETLANLIYGPSAISLEYALSFYGLIPERVEDLTSITTKRNKYFKTPVGNFSYLHIHHKKYPIGIDLIEFPNKHSVLFATKEKALCDYLILKTHLLRSMKNLKLYLLENMRIEEESLQELNVELLTEIARQYQHSNINLLLNYIQGEFRVPSA